MIPQALKLGIVEREEARKFLASMGLYLYCNAIFRTAVKDGPALSRSEIAAVQALWDAEWERLKPVVKEQLGIDWEAIAAEREAKVKQAEAAAQRDQERYRLQAKLEGERARAEDAAKRKLKDRARHLNEYMAGGFDECHLYGPRGFKNPFKYEDVPAIWAMPTILPRGRVRGSLSYRPSRPLTDNQALSIVTASICGDPPKGRSALEARAALYG